MPRSDPGVTRYTVYADRLYVVEGVACLFTWLRSGTKWMQVVHGDYRQIFQRVTKFTDPKPWVDCDGERHEDQLPPAVVDAMGPAVFAPRMTERTDAPATDK